MNIEFKNICYQFEADNDDQQTMIQHEILPLLSHTYPELSFVPSYWESHCLAFSFLFFAGAHLSPTLHSAFLELKKKNTFEQYQQKRHEKLSRAMNFRDFITFLSLVPS